MEISEIREVVNLWTEEYKILGKKDFINHVQIFENKGATMGCSNPHPHGQIWAQSDVPLEISKKTATQEKYFNQKRRSLLADYLEIELKERTRVVLENNSFVALVPFWATWPFETMIIPKRHVVNIVGLDEKERNDYAGIYKDLTIRYDNLFETSFPYSAGIHQAPTDGNDHTSWHMHMCFYPPLLRSATVKKFMVGYELLCEPQRDITPEMAAAHLRDSDSVHYK